MKPRSLVVRLGFGGIAVLLIAALAVTGFGYFGPLDANAISIDDPEREFTTFAERQSTTVTYSIRNASNPADPRGRVLRLLSGQQPLRSEA
jgi:hypothetical protein